MVQALRDFAAGLPLNVQLSGHAEQARVDLVKAADVWLETAARG